jgi:hypothetical protein
MHTSISKWAERYDAKSFLIRDFNNEDLTRLLELSQEGFSFEETRTGMYEWAVKTPSQKVLGSYKLGIFLRNERLKIGNRDHIEHLRALEFLQLLHSLQEPYIHAA